MQYLTEAQRCLVKKKNTCHAAQYARQGNTKIAVLHELFIIYLRQSFVITSFVVGERRQSIIHILDEQDGQQVMAMYRASAGSTPLESKVRRDINRTVRQIFREDLRTEVRECNTTRSWQGRCA